MIRHILLAIGLGMSLMTAWNSASMSRSFNSDASVSPVQNHQPTYEGAGRPRGPGRSGYIVASS
ncbi:MAG TPA: hypothetical protein VFY85_11380 [Gemmatimonadaceae bacterium]|nr:hypothetical protein [Gemmatimonadaceae bacterium]